MVIAILRFARRLLGVRQRFPVVGKETGRMRPDRNSLAPGKLSPARTRRLPQPPKALRYT